MNVLITLNADLGDHDKLREEAYEAEEEEETLPSACPAHFCGKHIYDGCHHHLHGNELCRERTRRNKYVSKYKYVPPKRVHARLTCVSRPKRMSMIKKQMDHS